MGVVISMLRGVNVGGHNLIKMDALRALYESLGLRDPETYVQSGNVVFRTKEQDLAGLAGRIETGIERRFGFRPDVILRTAADLRRVIAGNPFGPGLEPDRLLVNFLPTVPTPQARAAVLKINSGPERLQLDGRELYLYFPDGMGRSKLPPLLAKALKNSGTGRNWNTVNKLLAMAQKMEASS